MVSSECQDEIAVLRRFFDGYARIARYRGYFLEILRRTGARRTGRLRAWNHPDIGNFRPRRGDDFIQSLLEKMMGRFRVPSFVRTKLDRHPNNTDTAASKLPFVE